MKIALISDIHFGVRNDNKSYLDAQLRFFDAVFFPVLEQNNITDVFILGDVFDRRKYINFNTLYEVKRNILDKMLELGCNIQLLVGNHDIAYKNTTKVNSPELVLAEYDNIQIYSYPEQIDFHGKKITLVPWITPENEDDAFSLIRNGGDILMGHFELNGFKMYQNTISCNDGLDASIFGGFDLVISGHFHQTSYNEKYNVLYLGSPGYFTWNDADCQRGFYLLDIDTNEFEFIENPDQMFHTIEYDPECDLMKFPFGEYTQRNVTLVVNSVKSDNHFNLFIQKLDAVSPLEVNMVDNTTVQMLSDLDEMDKEALENEDIVKMVDTYVDSMKGVNEPDTIKSMFADIYEEAVRLQNDSI